MNKSVKIVAAKIGLPHCISQIEEKSNQTIQFSIFFKEIKNYSFCVNNNFSKIIVLKSKG